jgi:hypothetical protein
MHGDVTRCQKIPQAQVFWVLIRQMVAQGKPSSIMYFIFGWLFFFHFFFKDALYFALALAASNWGDQAFQCNNIRFFFGCEKGPRYDLFLFINRAMEVGDMGDLFFLGVQT